MPTVTFDNLVPSSYIEGQTGYNVPLATYHGPVNEDGLTFDNIHRNDYDFYTHTSYPYSNFKYFNYGPGTLTLPYGETVRITADSGALFKPLSIDLGAHTNMSQTVTFQALRADNSTVELTVQAPVLSALQSTSLAALGEVKELTIRGVGILAHVAIDNFVFDNPPTGAVSITGTATQGGTLRASNTLVDPDGILGAVSYQWYADGAILQGATGDQLVLDQAVVGRDITVAARYTDASGIDVTKLSTGTGPVVDVNDAATGTVSITGAPALGMTLQASSALSDADGLGPVQYQWKAGGVDIAGANTSSLLLTAAEVGKQVTVVASFTDGGGFAESISSAATSAVSTSAGVTGGLTGTAGNDILSGSGRGPMAGGLGDDTYLVNNASMVIIENANGGVDLVRSSVSFTLAPNVENLTATGADAMNLTGNSSNNILTGNSAANRLLGGGGADVLIGGLGADRFEFTSVADSGTTPATWDVIQDFTRGQDKIDLSKIDASPAKGHQSFTLVASSGFTAPGQLRFDNGVLFGNTDVDADAEFAIQVVGMTSLQASDFA